MLKHRHTDRLDCMAVRSQRIGILADRLTHLRINTITHCFVDNTDFQLLRRLCRRREEVGQRRHILRVLASHDAHYHSNILSAARKAAHRISARGHCHDTIAAGCTIGWLDTIHTVEASGLANRASRICSEGKWHNVERRRYGRTTTATTSYLRLVDSVVCSTKV